MPKTMSKKKSKTTKPDEEVFYFTFPPEGGTKEITTGTFVLDFYSGKITLPNGNEEFISDNLKAHGIKACRSLLVRTNKTINVSHDGKGKYQITSTIFGENHLDFRILYIYTTETTNISIKASSSPNAMFFF